MSSQQLSSRPDTNPGTDATVGTSLLPKTASQICLSDCLLELKAIASCQYRAITSKQVVEAGFSRNYAARQVRDYKWQRIHKGVYITDTYPLAWFTRASAALLAAGPGAALSHQAAAYVLKMRKNPPDCIDVSVLGRGSSGLKTQFPTEFPVNGQSKYRVRLHIRTRPFDTVKWRAEDHAGYAHLKNYSPVVQTKPGERRFRRANHLYAVVLERTVLDLAPKCRTDQVVGTVTDATRVGMRPANLFNLLTTFDNIKYRKLLVDLVDQVKEGVESPLEYRLKQLLELHGLPDPVMQERALVGDKFIRQDMVWHEFNLCVETDGQLAHPGGKTVEDYWRDNLNSLYQGQKTLRFRWQHVVGTPCETVKQIVKGLRLGGWEGAVTPCSHCQGVT